ncbi:MAG: ImmA/IrrE family metallo-endopeptidase [Clostridia bacterium]|nr:ImmA/IrrE family metallo-endopeptidase [Clostridia bacterium]
METHDPIPMSRRDILDFAMLVRRRLGIQDSTTFVDVMTILEHVLDKLYPDFTCDVQTRAEMGHRHGLTYPNKHLILLREDVYDGACMGRGRDRFTVAHEIAHLLMHEGVDPQYARKESGIAVPRYLDPEWQSDAFAGYFLMAPTAIRGMNAYDIANSCGVSFDAARVQLSVTKK